MSLYLGDDVMLMSDGAQKSKEIIENAIRSRSINSMKIKLVYENIF